MTSRASALLNLGDRAAAHAELGRALVLNPGSAQAYLLRGLMRRGAGSVVIGLVLADMGQAIALNPFFAEAMAHRGAVYLQIGNQSGALADFDRALTLQPRSSPALFFKGVLRFQQKRYAQAAELFRRVLALAPVQHPIATLWLAASVAHQDTAIKGVLQPYLWWWEDDVWPAPLVRLWAGAASAEDVLDAMTRLDTDARAQGAFFLAQWYLAKGKTAAALDLLDLVRRHPRRHLLEVIITGKPRTD
jgi:lipoprotein NlpI